jgi:beta-galactosidase
VVRIGVLDTQGSETVNWNDVNVGQTALLDHWNFKEGSKQQVYVFSNAHTVELLVNGKSIGKQLNNGTGNMRNATLWKDIDYGKGGKIIAIARNKDGKEVARHEMQTAGKAVRLVINEERNLLRSEGVKECRSVDNSMASTPSSLNSHLSSNSLTYLNITAVDSKGRIVPGFNEPITVSVEGAATLYSLDNHDHYTSDLFHGVSTKNMKNGRMQVILRGKGEPGAITIKATTPKLKLKKKITK